MSQIEDDEIIVRRKKTARETKVVTREGVLKAVGVTLGVLRTKQHPRVQMFADAAAAAFAAQSAMALGARVAITEETGEASQMADVAESLAVSLEGVTKLRSEAIRAAVSHAVASLKPWVLLPGIKDNLMMRTYLAKELVKRLPGLVIASEAETIALAGGEAPAAGMDAAALSDAADSAAQAIAQEMHAAVMILKPGAVRIVAEERPPLTVKNAAGVAKYVAGWETAMAAVGAVFLGLLRNHKFAAGACTALACLVAAEIAAEKAPTPGAFAAAFADALYSITEEDIDKRMKISIKQ